MDEIDGYQVALGGELSASVKLRPYGSADASEVTETDLESDDC